MKRAEKGKKIAGILEKLYPETPIPLDHNSAYTLLVAVMLSAQTTDKKVNQVTPKLFQKADTPEKMIKLTREQIIEAIRPAGLHNAKSKNILATSHKLLMEYDGKVPQTQKELMELPGIGRKSSDIMMRFVWGAPNIAVDTHVFRLLWRLGWTDTLDEGKSAILVNDTTPDKYKYAAHMQLITHAKRVCKSKKPKCHICVIDDVCDKRHIDVPKSKLREVVNA